MRPDERAASSTIEREENSKRNIGRGIKTVASLGLAATGAGLSSRIIPFLSEHIPTDLAIKGISKVSPKVGEFLQKGMSKGLNVKEWSRIY